MGVGLDTFGPVSVYLHIPRAYSYTKDKFCGMIDEKCKLKSIENIQEFFEVIGSSISNFIKREKFKKKKFNFDDELKKLKSDKKLAYDIFLLSSEVNDYEKFNKINKSYKYKLRVKKNEEFRNQLMANKYDSKRLWINLKSLYKSKNEKINFVKIKDVIYDVPNAIANELNKAFISSINEIINNIGDSTRQNYLNNIQGSENTFDLVTIDEENLKFFLNVVKDKNFDDFISGGNLIDICANKNLNEVMLRLINKSIIESEMPDIFKLSIISPIPKVNNPTSPEEFRPINNLPVGEKLIENIIHYQLKNFLEDNNLIVENQHGFRESHSTETAMIKLVDNIVKNNEKEFVTVTVFLDFKRAFETVNREILLKKLKCYNFSEDTIKWFDSYLTNRRQIVKVNGIYSSELEVKCGVPQGSKISNTLFTIYINDIVKVVDCDVLMYADDTLLSISARTSCEAIEKMNLELIKLCDWLKFNKIALNTKKCNFMIFNEKVNSDLNIKIDDVELEKVDKTKYLGVLIDNRLRFNEHGDYIIKKMNKKLGLFRRVANKLNEENKVLYYKSIVQPHIDYCSFVFKMMDQQTLNSLQVVQNKCMRVINRENINELREKYKIVLVDTRINVNVIKSLNRILIKGKPSILNNLFVRNIDARVRQMRFANNLVIPNYLKKRAQKSFVFVAAREYNLITKFIHDNKLSNNNYINNVIKFYTK